MLGNLVLIGLVALLGLGYGAAGLLSQAAGRRRDARALRKHLLGEIEAAMLTHEAVREAIVMARKDGGDDRRLVAYFVVSGETPDVADLRAHLREGLPCPDCGTAVVKLRAAGRGTYVCPSCQPRPRRPRAPRTP